jgi:hypothetical protein
MNGASNSHPVEIPGEEHCYAAGPLRLSIMSNSLQQHSIKEVTKQLRLRMKRSGLDTVEVQVTRQCGKYQYGFTGSPEQITKAEEILAAWA